MGVKTVKATINGTDYSLEYNNSTGKWEKIITAPNITSFNLNGGYYPVTIVATNEAGTSSSVSSDNSDACKLVVKERVKPTIILLSPSSGAYVSNAQQPISFNVIDENNGSGINANSIVLKIDGTAISNITKSTITNGYNCSYTPSTTLGDGIHTIEIDAQDNDGNIASTVSSSFTVDTIPPVLNITSPQNNIITANGNVVVNGKTNDATSSPVVIDIKVNNVDAGSITVNSDGSFSKAIALTEGTNTALITATDKAGKTTSVTLILVLDTSVPVISDVSIIPNPVDAGATMIVSVVVE